MDVMRAALLDAAEEYGLAADRERLEAELQNFAYVDALTGIDNRHRFFEKGQAEFARARRYGRPLTVMMLGLDHFKRINDSHGHAAGDAVIAEAARRLSHNLREQDIFGRYGGEEFSILLIEVGGGRAEAVAERLCRAVAGAPVATVAGPLAVTVSSGLTELAAGDSSLAQILERADAALYRAKAGGRNRVETLRSNVTQIMA
jgi:diguanylate cyclase (GGDEF)-like protein